MAPQPGGTLLGGELRLGLGLLAEQADRSQTIAAKKTSACSVDMRIPPRFWSFCAPIPHSRSGSDS